MIRETFPNPGPLHRRESSSAPPIDLYKLLAIVRRQWRIAALSVGVCLLLGILYLLFATAKYTASTDILIDQDSSRILYQGSALERTVEDEARILSQVEVLVSDKVGLAVVDKLALDKDPKFMSAPMGPLQMMRSMLRAVTSLFSSPGPASEENLQRRAALQNLQRNLSVERLNRSYVLNVRFTWSDPVLAAKVAKGVAEAYLADQLNAKFEATRLAGGWAQERMKDLQREALKSDLAVQKFRADHGLIAASGKLVSEQQLSELNSQLILARTETAAAEAKYQRLQSIIDGGQPDAIVAGTLDSAIVNDLRAKYLEASRLAAEIAEKTGPDHVQVKRLRNSMDEYRKLIFDELGRIAKSYSSEYQVAKSREDALRSIVTDATGISADANETLVQLRELEREAEAYRDLYQKFLQRYQESVQQESFPVTEARIISEAAVPQETSGPKKSLVLALSIFLGLALGTGLGTLQEYRDRFFRTGEQVAEETGMPFLGLVPLVPEGKAVTSYAVDHPLSHFAETLRSAKISADLSLGREKPKVIGVTSVLPGEGKSTVAINFARLLASQKARTLIIDADLRNPTLTRAVAPNAAAGLAEIVIDKIPLADLLLFEERTRLAMLPAVLRRDVPLTSELLASREMAELLEEAKASFDYVILDLPPLAPVVDVRAVTPHVDGFTCVVEWGQTPRAVVQMKLEADPALAKKCLGIILNKANMDKMKLYGTEGMSYGDPRYSAYFREAAPAEAPGQGLKAAKLAAPA
ncbi:polysaccharide biosynthesis tyrosine autokinase [Nordella sp. HKS 07]|uniref:polysaccharide biosynthesis tyrosine autokinase n=1 Tax=Nordella sp. HKS 07 TaxID=2712222 RepID=UPI0013E13688|nr:polysaccharide biosynthesis tyrosine autokinase [Nordella sp. HKS 07]QIG49747.1 polysaccharide biosynthesis tyrosine autokinase [Nordella sp. HKS 07]